METRGVGAVDEGMGGDWAAIGAGSIQDISKARTGIHGQAVRSIIHTPLHHSDHGAITVSAAPTMPDVRDSSASRVERIMRNGRSADGTRLLDLPKT